MRVEDWFGSNWLRYYQSSFETAIEDELEAELANVKTRIYQGNQSALTAYLAGRTLLERSLKGQDEIRVKAGIPTILPTIWTSVLDMAPPYGQPVSIIDLIIDVRLPGNSATTCAYIGMLANNDLLANPSTLTSMPYYMAIQDSQGQTPFADVSAYTLASSILEPTQLTIRIPFSGMKLGTKGLNVYFWDEGVSGFLFNSVKITYRSSSAL